VKHCGQALRSSTAVKHCGQALRSSTAVKHCGQALRSSTAAAGLTALAAAVLFFAACESPVNPSHVTNTEGVLAVSGPEWVNAKAYPGANLITWAFAKDAKTYTVYRQRSDRSDALVHLTTTNSQTTENNAIPGSFVYLDVVSFDNQLVHEAEYVYYVTANSGQGITGRAVSGNDATVINDGASSATVTANIPPRDTPVANLVLDPDNEAFTVDSIKEETVQANGTEQLLLTWPQYNPAFQYQVAYDFGTKLTLNQIIQDDQLENIVPQGTVLKYYRAPLFGGTNTARITLSLGEVDAYYYKPQEFSKSLAAYTLSTIPLGSSTNWKITSVTRTVGDNTSATITWTPLAEAPDADYKLYRIQANGITSDDGKLNNSATAVGDWAEVTGPKTLVDDNGTFKFSVTDTGLSASKGYIYALYTETGAGAKSETVVYAIKPADAEDPSLAAESSYVADAEGNRTYSVTIGWKAQSGATYKLERAPKTTYPTTSIGAFINVPTGTSVAGRYTVVDTPAIRSAYLYRLTVTYEGITRVYEKELKSEPFSDTVNAKIKVDSSTAYAYATKVTITLLDDTNPNTNPTLAYYDNDLEVDIYRAEGTTADTGKFGQPVGNVNFDRVAEKVSLRGEDNTYEDKDLKIGTKYVYRLVVKTSAGKELHNTNTALSGNSGYVQEPSKPTFTSSNVSAAGNSGSIYYYKVTPGTGPFLGAKVEVQRKADGNSPWSFWADASVSNVQVGSTPPTGSSLTAGNYYFSVTKPTSPSGQYRIVLVDQDGTVASTAATGATVLVSLTW
ncbi:MAG: hypothetical protein LBG24_01835, partial [Treponema sp.]|nr:hypothetical protein [Treponema sp.]